MKKSYNTMKVYIKSEVVRDANLAQFEEKCQAAFTKNELTPTEEAETERTCPAILRSTTFIFLSIPVEIN